MSELVNPYIAGAPVTETKMFFGRDDIFEWIERSLAGKYTDHVLVVHGQRRVGKTSVLKQLGNRLPKRYVPIFFDLQGRTHTTLDRFLWYLAREIVRVLKQERGIILPAPETEAFTANPDYLETHFLPTLESALADNTLLLTIDEFDTLEEPDVRETLARPLIDYLRRLMGRPGLTFIFSIGSSGRKLENMQASYTEFFKSALYKKISFLEREQTHRLVTSPVQGILEYEIPAVERIYRITSGHPYFTQLICHELFARCQQTDQRTIAETDVEAVLDDVVERGTVNLKFVWDEATDLEKWVLASLAHLSQSDQHSLVEALRRQRVRFNDKELNSALLRIREKDVLANDNRFIIHLMKLWLEKNRPLERVQEELVEVNPIANRFIEIAQTYKDQGLADKAIESFQQALQVDAVNIQAQVGIASVWLDQKNYERAVTEFDKALTIDDDDVAARAGLCDAYLALGDQSLARNKTREALQAYQKVLGINAEHTDARQRMAEIYRQRAEKALTDGKDEEAINAFGDALKFTPEDQKLVARYAQVRKERQARFLAALLTRAEKERAAKNYDRAIATLEDARDLAPDDTTLSNRIAAIKEEQRTARLAAVFARADKELSAKNYDRAIATLEDARALVTDESTLSAKIVAIKEEQRTTWLAALFLRADKEQTAKNWDRAVAALEEALKISPEDGTIQTRITRVRQDQRTARLASILERAEQARAAESWDDAITALEEYLALQPDESVRVTIGEIQKQKREAQLWSIKARARGMAKVERWNDALAAWREYLALEPKDRADAQAEIAKTEQARERAHTYSEAQTAITKKDYDKAIHLLKEIVIQEANYKDASHLMAQAIELRRTVKPVWQNKWLLGGIGAVGVLLATVFLAWLLLSSTPSASPAIVVSTSTPILGAISIESATPTSPSNPTMTPTSTATFTPSPTPTRTMTPTPIPFSWSRLSSGQFFSRDTITAIALDPTDAGVMYVGTQNAGIYKTLNGGISWQPMQNGLGRAAIDSLVIDPKDTRTLYAGVLLGGLYKTTDGGQNWKSLSENFDLRVKETASIVALDPQDNRHMFYSPASALYESNDGGATWNKIEKSKCPEDIADLVMHPIDNKTMYATNLGGQCANGVYKSSDGGKTWTDTGLLVMENWRGRPLKIDGQKGSLLYIATYDAVYRSTDGGKTWNQPARPGCIAMTLMPDNGATAYCVRVDGLAKTSDSGQTWQLIANISGYTLAVSQNIKSMLVLGGAGASVSTDGGVGWTSRSSGLAGIGFQMLIDPSDSAILYTEDMGCSINRSTDRGRNWQAITSTGKGCDLQIDVGGQALYLSNRVDNFSRSLDKGKTWETLALPAKGDVRVIAHPTKSGWLYAVYNGSTPSIYSSSNNGTSWQKANAPSSSFSNARLFFDAAQVVYAINEGFDVSARSSDSGQTWAKCVDQTNWSVTRSNTRMAIDPRDSNRLLLGSRGSGIFVSTDGCKSWQATNLGLGNLFVNTIVSDPKNPDRIYAGTDGGVYISSNGGKDWGVVNQGLLGATVIYSIVVDPKDSSVYAATPYGIFRLESK